MSLRSYLTIFLSAQLLANSALAASDMCVKMSAFEVSYRKDCGGNAYSCRFKGCCWDPVDPNPGNAPSCFFPDEGACVCSGQKNRDGQGGSCSLESHDYLWCYVDQGTCQDQQKGGDGLWWSESVCAESGSRCTPPHNNICIYIKIHIHTWIILGALLLMLDVVVAWMWFQMRVGCKPCFQLACQFCFCGS